MTRNHLTRRRQFLPHRQARGFSLVEMAVVIFIFGLMLVSGIRLLQSRADTAMRETNEAKLTVAREALLRYLAENNRLPCPDTSTGSGPGALAFSVASPPDGIENRATAGDATTACAGNFGVLPYTTLGLSRDTALDAWQNFISYHVSNAADKNWTISTVGVATAGGLTVRDRPGNAALTDVTTGAAVILVSHGPNGLGAFTSAGTRNALPPLGTLPDEAENTNADSTYVRRERTDDAGLMGGAFDDHVLYLTNNEIFGPLLKEGTVKSVQAKRVEDRQLIIDAVVGRIAKETALNGACTNNLTMSAKPEVMDLSSVLPGANLKDAYGTNYQILLGTSTSGDTLSLTVPNVPNLITIRSFGPNKTDNSGAGDDEDMSVSTAYIRGRMLNSLTGTGCT